MQATTEENAILDTFWKVAQFQLNAIVLVHQ